MVTMPPGIASALEGRLVTIIRDIGDAEDGDELRR